MLSKEHGVTVFGVCLIYEVFTKRRDCIRYELLEVAFDVMTYIP